MPVELRVLGIITARGGSKGIPGKNLVEVCGTSLLAHTANSAKSSNLTQVILSTDDPEIAAAGREIGIEVPFTRPLSLARDDTSSLAVLQHAVAELEAAGEHYDAIFTLQPTNPLRLTSDIDGAIELLNETHADSVIGYTPVGERHPARMKTISNGKVVDPPFAEQFEGQRRQELPKYFLRDGAVYLTRRDVLMNDHSIKGQDCRAWIIPPQRALNIDEQFDLYLCEQLMKLGPDAFPGHAG